MTTVCALVSPVGGTGGGDNGVGGAAASTYCAG